VRRGCRTLFAAIDAPVPVNSRPRPVGVAATSRAAASALHAQSVRSPAAGPVRGDRVAAGEQLIDERAATPVPVGGRQCASVSMLGEAAHTARGGASSPSSG
jgi:hypothetical protein